MEVNWICVVDSNGFSEVQDCFVEVLIPVPDKTSAIERRCIYRIESDDKVKVVHGELELVSSDLFPDGSQMMEC